MDRSIIKVLLVEDDDDDVFITRKLLSRIEGTAYPLDSVASYEAGLEAIVKGEHDICLLDYRLGERNGLEFLSQAVGKGCKMPIILLTGVGDRQVDLKAARAGASDYMVKGQITAPLLERSIRYAIESRKIQDSRDSALESARLKSEFLANMSHEIRTPMNGVIGIANLLLDTELGPEQRKMVQTVKACGDSLLAIISDILDFSKIEAGKLDVEISDFDPRRTVESVIELLVEQANDKGIELAALVHSSVSAGLRGDAGRLRQVLTNLIGNALKFTEVGEVFVDVKQETNRDLDAILRFTINDTGAGIPVDVRPRLFQAFTQADGSTTRKYGGTGLGLAISKQLVELMGGEIGFASEPGKGSTFWFTVRMQKQLAGPDASTLPGRDTGDLLSGLRLLIVQRNDAYRKVLVHQTNAWGMISAEAECGPIAHHLINSAAAKGEIFDLILLDPQIVADGFEFVRALKVNKLTAGARVILLSSSGQRGQAERARQFGVAGSLTMPISQSQLFDCLASVMGKLTGDSGGGGTSKLITPLTLVEARARSKVRILLVEDYLINQEVAVGQLKNLGYRADVADDGFAALQALERDRYDIVLMDCQMPKLDGYAATEEIRRREGTARHTPIIAMTANAMIGDREKCIAAGMDDYLTKPIQAEDLKRALEQWSLPASGKVESTFGASVQTLPAVDKERLLDAVGKEGLIPAQFVEFYRNQMSDELHRLRTAIRADSGAEVTAIAHGCAGMNANCGLLGVVAPLRELERMGREGKLEGAELIADKVNFDFGRIQLVLTTMLDTERTGDSLMRNGETKMKKIVIIEDHPVLISIYRSKFIAAGFQVEIASDGESGLALINRIRPGLVVLDLAMPKVNGIEVLKSLRASPLFQDLPIIVFSDSAWKEQAGKEGATVVLSKSIHSPSEVVEAVRKTLLTSQSQQIEETHAPNVAFLAAASASGNSTHSRPTEGHVLLVEDHYDVRTTISSALDRSGFLVTGVESHAAALYQIEATEFDAFLLNRLCPDGIGLSLCHQLRQLYPQKPIVVYSALALSIAADQRLNAGASAYLTEAGDILNPGRILLKLIDEAKTALGNVDSNAANELSMLTN